MKPEELKKACYYGYGPASRPRPLASNWGAERPPQEEVGQPEYERRGPTPPNRRARRFRRAL